MNASNTSIQESHTQVNHRFVIWGAVSAGVVVALGVEYLFNLLGLGLGFTAFDFDIDTVKNLSMGSYAWLMLVGIFSMFIGGMVSGFATGSRCVYVNVLHSLVAWAVATLVTFYMVTTAAGTAVGGVALVFGKTLSAAGETVEMVGKGVSDERSLMSQVLKSMQPDIEAYKNKIKQQENSMWATEVQTNSQNQESGNKMTKNNSTADKEKQFEQNLNVYLNAQSGQDINDARQNLTRFMEKNTGLTQTQIKERVDNWKQQYNELSKQAQQKVHALQLQAEETAEKTSEALGAISIITFFSFVLSAIASALGAMLSVRVRK